LLTWACANCTEKSSALLQALRKVPDVNASWHNDFIRVYHNVDVSVAVQTPNGLMVPVVRDADILGLAEISATVKELAAKVGLLACVHCSTLFGVHIACRVFKLTGYRLLMIRCLMKAAMCHVASAVLCSPIPCGWIEFMQ
jgi:hypothetical protein